MFASSMSPLRSNEAVGKVPDAMPRVNRGYVDHSRRGDCAVYAILRDQISHSFLHFFQMGFFYSLNDQVNRRAAFGASG